MTVYFDHAATTPLRAEARTAWLAAQDVVGNASSVHASGQAARRLLEEARESVAANLDCDPIEVVFTSGGTEAINLALKGAWWSRSAGRDTVVVPEGEHHATMDAAAWLASAEGARIRHVPLSATGEISPTDFSASLTPGVALATALVANNEVGTVSDAAALADAARRAEVPLHLDAVAAAGSIPVTFATWRGGTRRPDGLAMLSVSGHKVGAPVGTGALVVSRYAHLTPLLHGGGQQRGLRAGTQDVAGAAALAAALRASAQEAVVEHARVRALRDELIAAVRRAVPEAELLGDPDQRIPGNAHFFFPGAAGETLLFLLDQEDISVSTGSACQAGVTEPSHVVIALGRGEADARSVLRFTLGRTTTSVDVSRLASVLPEVYRRAVAAGAPAPAVS